MNKDMELKVEDVTAVEDFLDTLSTEIGGDFRQGFGSLMNLSEEQFILVAPGVLEAFQRSVNNPNDKLALAQSVNAMGITLEEVMLDFAQIADAVDGIKGYSNRKKDFIKGMLAAIVNAIKETEGISKRNIAVPIELCHEDAKIPQYANVSDSGLDVFALEDVTVLPGETKLIPTGIKVALPPGYELQVRPKSGRALKTKLRISNSPGTIDAGYRDEVGIIIDNIEAPIKDIGYEFDDNGQPVIQYIERGAARHITKGEKFCQLVLSEVPKASFYRVETIAEIGEDRGGGFGSTSIYDKDDKRYMSDVKRQER